MESSAPEQFSVPPPPIFVQGGSADAVSKPSILSLDDIFDEFLFSNDKPQVRSSGNNDKKGENSENDTHDLRPPLSIVQPLGGEVRQACEG